MYKLVFFVPESHLELVKSAVFAAGAGAIGNYDQCCWQTKGIGQFRPLTGSKPFVGQAQQLEQVTEYRVEMVCDDALITSAITALRAAHPYEEPAIDVWQLAELAL
jgi:hypothetical protein